MFNQENLRKLTCIMFFVMLIALNLAYAEETVSESTSADKGAGSTSSTGSANKVMGYFDKMKGMLGM